MKKLLIIMLINCAACYLQAQDFIIQREVRGVVKKQNGNRYKRFYPLYVKDGKGNQLDIHMNNSGEYFFVATVGDTLTYFLSQSGVKKQVKIKLPAVGDLNVIVPNRSNSAIVLEITTTASPVADNPPVVYSMDDHTPAHYFQRLTIYEPLSEERIWNIQKIEPGKSIPSDYSFSTNRPFLEITANQSKSYKKRPTGFELRFSSRLGVEQQTSIPASQKSYAQGIADGGQLTWKGPELNQSDADNLFAWGPAIGNLEYDGSDYPFDANGRLVSKGSGNGHPANVYNDPSFFRTGFVTRNDLQVLTAGLFKGYTQIGIGQKLRQSPMRNSSLETYSAGLGFKNMRWAQDLTGELNATYDYSAGRLVNHGANLASVMKALMLTPPTFDNTNGLSAEDALAGNQAYLVPPGSIRSYAPAYADNPYFLLSQLPDRDRDHHLFSTAKINYQYDDFHVEMSGSYNWLRNDQKTGLPLRGSTNYQEGRLTQQVVDQSTATFRIAPSYYSWEGFNFSMYYQYTWMQSDMDLDSQGTTGYHDHYYGFRRMHELFYRVEYTEQSYRGNFSASIANKHYFSNTAKGYSNIFPSATVKVNMANLVNDWTFTDIFHNLTIGATVSRSIYETPLLYGSPAALSTFIPSSRFDRYYEYAFIGFTDGLKPEISSNFEFAFLSQFAYNFRFDLNYTGVTTRDFVAPVYNGSHWQPENVAKVRNCSFTAAASYRIGANWDRPAWGVKLMWARTKSTVRDLYGTDDHIALAGFSNIRTVLAEGQPVGAIYGSDWQRDDQGRRVIGGDGFPVKDATLRMIGDPTPDWTASIIPNVSWKGFNIDFTVEFRKGGDVWNGTRAAMDYYGMSKETASDRGVTGYVFDGITASGQANTTAIDFYNPAQPLADNRWIRYGVDGVGEEYIEDASWIRLSEVALSYTIPYNSLVWKFSEIKLALTGRNLLIWTPYTGVDPSSPLFNYTSGAGLDLFNLPGVRSFMFSIEMKF